jgi:sugar lactone lactonase YvrE
VAGVRSSLSIAVRVLALGALALFEPARAQSPPVSDAYIVERLVQPSAFHGVHGLTFDANDVLYAGSVVGHSIYRVDTATGKVETFVGPPEGMADDLVFLPDGTLVWTAISQGVVRARKGTEPPRVLANLVSVNSVNVRRSDGRLFVGQVFGGDGVWELDPAGSKPPRSIVRDPGGFNGFDIGPDGCLYGPLWFRHQVVRIDPDSGALKVIADGFDTPAAANFDSKWNLYVLDTARGELVHVDIGTGAKRLVAQLATSLDNLAIDSKDRIFVSNMADNGIQEVDARTGAVRQVVKGQLAVPVAIAGGAAAGAPDTIFVADVFAFRRVDARTGAVTDIERAHAAGTRIGYPIGVATSARHVILTNNEGPVQRYDGATLELLQSWGDMHGVQNAIELPDGSLVLAQTAAGKLVRLLATGQRVDVARQLGAPFGLVPLDAENVYVGETLAGRIARVNVANGSSVIVASALDRPQGLALAADGTLLVVEAGRRQLTRIDPKSGRASVVASNLPIGIPNVPITAAGVAVGSDGTLYVSSDAENSIWRLRPKQGARAATQPPVQPSPSEQPE